MQHDITIKVSELSKSYKLYEKPIDRLKESLHPFGKKYHREFHALNNISFEIKRGETVGIIGKNGSGKSTMLKMITGVVTPTSGHVQVNGKISALLELGAGFNPEFTGLENIYLNGTIMGYSKEEMDNKISAILEFADIGDFINQPVKLYSSGMFARLAFSVAINVDPDILIVDEALSVGDLFFQNKCYKKFEELQARNITILFVTHDISSIKQMCSRVLWLNDGVQVMFGEKEEVCSAYLKRQFTEMNRSNEGIAYANQDKIERIVYQREKAVFPRLQVQKNQLHSEIAEIASFFIKDNNNQSVQRLCVGENYHIHIVGKFKQNVEDLIFGFILENHKGINLLSINTFIESSQVFRAIQGEIIEVIFKLTLPKIMRGSYLLSPAIAKGDQQNHIMLTWLQNVLTIEVENLGYNLSLVEIESESIIHKYADENVIFN